jgi:hypothetical protein
MLNIIDGTDPRLIGIPIMLNIIDGTAPKFLLSFLINYSVQVLEKDLNPGGISLIIDRMHSHF